MLKFVAGEKGLSGAENLDALKRGEDNSVAGKTAPW